MGEEEEEEEEEARVMGAGAGEEAYRQGDIVAPEEAHGEGA